MTSAAAGAGVCGSGAEWAAGGMRGRSRLHSRRARSDQGPGSAAGSRAVSLTQLPHPGSAGTPGGPNASERPARSAATPRAACPRTTQGGATSRRKHTSRHATSKRATSAASANGAAAGRRGAGRGGSPALRHSTLSRTRRMSRTEPSPRVISMVCATVPSGWGLKRATMRPAGSRLLGEAPDTRTSPAGAQATEAASTAAGRWGGAEAAERGGRRAPWATAAAGSQQGQAPLAVRLPAAPAATHHLQ